MTTALLFPLRGETFPWPRCSFVAATMMRASHACLFLFRNLPFLVHLEVRFCDVAKLPQPNQFVQTRVTLSSFPSSLCSISPRSSVVYYHIVSSLTVPLSLFPCPPTHQALARALICERSFAVQIPAPQYPKRHAMSFLFLLHRIFTSLLVFC